MCGAHRGRRDGPRTATRGIALIPEYGITAGKGFWSHLLQYWVVWAWSVAWSVEKAPFVLTQHGALTHTSLVVQ